jgi:hypoxanthine phosphoribosyltransferase
VLLVDTIIDTGKTMHSLFKLFGARNPATLKAVVLLDKKSRRTVDITMSYIGFEIPDTFVVGYGMDHGEKYRNLPYITALKPAAP